MDAQKKKYEGKLYSQIQQYEEKIEDLKEENNKNLIDQKIQIAVSLLSSKKMSVSEIANMTKLTEEVVEKTIAKYKEAYELLTGKEFE